jgi:hypothetical protein
MADMMLTGRVLDAAEAERVNLVQYLAEPGAALRKARERAGWPGTRTRHWNLPSGSGTRSPPRPKLPVWCTRPKLVPCCSGSPMRSLEQTAIRDEIKPGLLKGNAARLLGLSGSAPQKP